MNELELINFIRIYCKVNSNKANREKYNYYYKEEQDFYGLTAPQINQFAKDFTRQHKPNLSTLINAAPELIKSSKHEESIILIVLLRLQAKHFTPNLLDEFSKWYALGIRNWAQADSMAMYLLHELHARKIVHYKAFEPWITSPYPFQRRSVPVSMVKWGKKHPHIPELLAFNEPLMTDSIREVHQGIGWFLRECWTRDPLATEDFLMKYKETSARLIFQYACEKMTAEKRILFRRKV